MAVSIAVPDLGSGLAGGIVAEWYVDDGAVVDAGELICRVESAFLAIELEAGSAGFLHHRTPLGALPEADTVLAVILAPGEVPPEDAPLERTGPGVTTADEPSPDEPSAQAGVPLPEFEDALVEAIVVPFPKKFAGTAGRAWDSVPGDAVAFDSSLFGESEHDRARSLEEPGGSIPGLPLWEPEEARSERDEPERRFNRIRDEAAAGSQILTMTMIVDLTEAERMRGAFDREWGAEGPSPMLEDVVFRAIARALEDTPFAGGAGAMLVATTECDLAFAVREPASRSFRDGVKARADGGDEAFESADWLFVSLAALGVSSATPRLEPGRHMSFALGAKDASNRASLKVAYDSSCWSEGSAARLLARVRDILDLPYAMLT